MRWGVAVALTCPPTGWCRQKQESNMVTTAVDASMFPLTSQVQLKKASCVRCEKLQGVWGLRSLGECMKDHSWLWRSCWVHSSGANQTCRFQEKKKHLTTIFSLSWTRCARPRYMMFVATAKKTVSAVKPPYVSMEIHKQEVEIPEFLVGSVSRFLSVGLLTGW